MSIKSLIKIPRTKYPVWTIVRWLWKTWRGNRLQAFLNAAIGLAQVAVSLAQVWAVKHAIDAASGTGNGSIYFAVALMGILIMAGSLLASASVWVRNLLGVKARNNMQQRTLDRLLRSEWQGRRQRHSGDILNRLEQDVATIIDFLTETIPNTLSVVAMFVGAFFYLFSMDKTLAFITVAIIPVFLGGSKIYVRRMRKLTRSVRDADSRVQSVMQEAVQHSMLIKSLEGEDAAVGRLETIQSHLRYKIMHRTAFALFSNLFLNSGFAAGYLVAFLWAALRMFQHTLSFGGMTAFLQLVSKIQSPARDLTKLVPAFVYVITSAERIMELEETPIERRKKAVIFSTPLGIRFDNVSFAYEDGTHKVIDRLSFDFKPGSVTAILGETGSGKTTIIRMLLGLVCPQNGRISVYGQGVDSLLTPELRCNFTYVPQGNSLMSGTVRDNLRMGKPDATDEEMYAALDKSVAGFVSEMPDKLDTRCSERGGGMSEGQAQRIAIARALLRKRPVMLLDEATSALDPETEMQVLKNILENNDSTIIFITHREAITKFCHDSLKIDKIR